MTGDAVKQGASLFSAEDARLLLPVCALLGIGLVMLFSASAPMSITGVRDGFHFFRRQLIAAGIGLAVMLGARFFPYRWYRPLAYPMLLGLLILLASIGLFDLGLSAGGSNRWMRLGPLTFQPAELARVVLAIYLAYSLSKKLDRIERFSISMMPHLLVLGVVGWLLLAQPDYGTVVLLTAMVWVVLFYSGVRLRHLLLPLPLIGAGFVYLMVTTPYRLKRYLGFLEPWQRASTEGYHLVHSQMAFGTGGWWGVGIGNGYQKLFYLPEPHTDFIFAVIGEELGLIRGVLVVVALYGWIIWRGLRIAARAPDPFGALLAVGLTAGIGIQACVNMGVTLGLLPTKGLTLPFLSYGGTSLLVFMGAIGILMNISAASGR